MPSPIQTLPAPVIGFVNHVLNQNGRACERLRAFAGRTVRITFDPLEFDLAIGPQGLVEAASGGQGPENGSHQGSSAGQGGPNVTLTLSPLTLPRFVFDPEGAMRDVRIAGDADLAQLLGQLVREVRWDAEDDLARVVGDIAAHRVARDARNLQGYARDASQRLTETVTAFLLDEDPTLVRRALLEALATDTARLRDDCARFEKRLELLETKRPPP